jgi:hypothetical protein
MAKKNNNYRFCHKKNPHYAGLVLVKMGDGLSLDNNIKCVIYGAFYRICYGAAQ